MWNGSWSRQPVHQHIDNDNHHLLVEAAENSDWWTTTAYGFVHDDGHALLVPWNHDVAAEVSFLLKGFNGNFDQAGLMVWVDSKHWIKLGVEVSDGHPQVGAVVTNDKSDWSISPVPEWVNREVTVRASRLRDAVVMRARVDGGDWRTVRVAPFSCDSALIGPMFCAPTRSGFVVEFTKFRFVQSDVDLHSPPPA